MTCQHESFAATCNVHRLTQVEGGPVIGYTMAIVVRCTTCNLPFRFRGLPAGSLFDGAAVSADATELRAAIEPAYVQEICGVPIVSGRA